MCSVRLPENIRILDGHLQEHDVNCGMELLYHVSLDGFHTYSLVIIRLPGRKL